MTQIPLSEVLWYLNNPETVELMRRYSHVSSYLVKHFNELLRVGRIPQQVFDSWNWADEPAYTNAVLKAVDDATGKL